MPKSKGKKNMDVSSTPIAEEHQTYMKSTKRIVSPLNDSLSSIIPVLYGAVLSYALYIAAQLIVDFIQHNSDTNKGIALHEFGISIITFAVVICFLMQDFGGITKIQKVYPYRRTSRYTHEILIAFFYLASFALLVQRSIFSVMAFSFAITWGGVWCNQLKEEYLGDDIAKYATTQRNLQYIGGALFMAQASSFLIYRNTSILTYPMVISVMASYAVWISIYALYLSKRHPEFINDYSIFITIPDNLLK